ncbi:hypothetical protein [Mammaliicoccus lentus]|uniref:hypothetical protein n=1 Tax=Mammaliicoccus lentus TaxID=42858 RepID=UPI002DB8F8DA|nr:hypothetical protein [Mammaliicoccus lentus]MEB8091825.1 hypothetical protein [Mammaliicoccus lentus]
MKNKKIDNTYLITECAYEDIEEMETEILNEILKNEEVSSFYEDIIMDVLSNR